MAADRTPEEKFNGDLWYVLQKIKERGLYTINKKSIEYSIVQGFFGTPYNDDEEALLEKLNEWKIITLEDQDGFYGIEHNGSRIFSIKAIDHAKFMQLYQLYEKAQKNNITDRRLQQLVQELTTPTGKDDDLNFELWQLIKTDDDDKNDRTMKSLLRPELTNIQLMYNLSTENRSRIKRLIELIQNQVELTGFKYSLLEKDPLKIPIETLQREGFGISETELLIDTIDRTADSHFIKIIRLERRPWMIDSDVIVPGVSTGFGRASGDADETKKELRLELRSPAALQAIKAHIEGFEKRLAESLIEEKIESKIPIGKYAEVKEPIKIKTLGIEISGKHICKGTEKAEINDTDKWLIYFLYYRFIENKDECFKTDRLVMEMESEIGKKSERYIENRISVINKIVKELVVKGKTNIRGFIKSEQGRGYHLNPKIVI